MKLQKQLSRKYRNKNYPKWVITIPPAQVSALGWKEGEYLESKVNDNELILSRENPNKAQKRREATEKAGDTRKKKGR